MSIFKKEDELKKFKEPLSLDEALIAKLDPIINAINEHVEKIYKDFNEALYKQHEQMNGITQALIDSEKNVTHMVQILWGIVNKANARSSALEKVLIKNGLKQEEFEEEIIAVEKALLETGEWEEATLPKILNKQEEKK